MTQDLPIGEAAKAAGLSVDAIRFYEREGILIRAPRTAGGRRLYGPAEIHELTLIARLRAVRMSLPEIARYLVLNRQGDAALAERTQIVAAQRERVVQQIESMQETLRILDLKLAHAARVGAEAKGGPGAPRRALKLVSGAEPHD